MTEWKTKVVDLSVGKKAEDEIQEIWEFHGKYNMEGEGI